MSQKSERCKRATGLREFIRVLEEGSESFLADEKRKIKEERKKDNISKTKMLHSVR